ncbi:MAG: DUF4373 domain-containing protein [Oscillospiraceae bacterium]|nr:DUF4373 domain-containing protein [Oscillospiraceae bacterium]
MARPIKLGLDSFYFDVDFFNDKKVRRIKKDCGVSSISLLICLLTIIYRNGYCVLFDKDIIFEVSDIVGVDEDDVSRMVEKALEVGFFDRGMLQKFGILTSLSIQKNFNSIIKEKKLKQEGISSVHNLLINTSSHLNNESRVNKVFIPPTLDEVESYCLEHGYTIDSKFFIAYYSEAGWLDNDNKIVNWKQKIVTWESNQKRRENSNGGYRNNIAEASVRNKGSVNDGEVPTWGKVYK